MTALTPVARMLLSIIQMQFIFLNTTDLDMGRHKVISRFGLMHMVATNLCEWLYVLVEETKHEIHHLHHNVIATNYRESESIRCHSHSVLLISVCSLSIRSCGSAARAIDEWKWRSAAAHRCQTAQ